MPPRAKAKTPSTTSRKPRAKAPAKPARAKPARAKPARAKPAAPRARAAPAGPRPTAGKRILAHLGITDAELAAFVPPGKLWTRAVFLCELLSPLDEAALAARFAGRYGVVDQRTSRGGRADVRTITLTVPGRYVAYTFWREGARWKCEAAFREMGTFWHSNHAIWARFKQLELPTIDATDVVDLTA